jgi:hypothetical protein
MIDAAIELPMTAIAPIPKARWQSLPEWES